MSFPHSKNLFERFGFFPVLTFLFDFHLNLFYYSAAMRKDILNHNLTIQRLIRITD